MADDLGTWLIGKRADAGSKKLFEFVLGTDQERALHRACRAALAATAGELRPGDATAAGEVAIIKTKYTKRPRRCSLTAAERCWRSCRTESPPSLRCWMTLTSPPSPGGHQPMRWEYAVGWWRKYWLATCCGRSSAAGVRGGPPEPIANLLDHDRTYLQGQRLEGMVEHQNKMLVSMLAIVEQAFAVQQPPVPVDQIARELGFDIRVVDLSIGVDARLRVAGAGSIIELASGQPGVRHRFSIGHELGHACLGHRHGETEVAEREANAFAGPLLVPVAPLPASAPDVLHSS